MKLINKEMKEKIIVNEGNRVTETRYMLELMEEVRKMYEGADVESLGVKFDDVYEVMLASVYIKGFEDALNSIDIDIENIEKNEGEKHEY